MMRALLPAAALLLAGCSSRGPYAAPDGGPVATAAGAPLIAGCPLFPPDNAWNRDVSGDPVDPHSAEYLAQMNAGSGFLQPDFGSDPSYGLPYLIVDHDQPRQAMSFLYSSQSEPGPYPFPPDIPLQANADRHAVVIERDACLLFETFDTHRVASGFQCGSGAIFNLRSNALRPDGFTSAAASGLPLFPGLARFEEVKSGELHHALAFTASRIANAYVHPATHGAGNSSDAFAPPMGLRVRLKAGYDLSRFQGGAKVLLLGLRHYGMFVSDIGSDWAFSGATDTRWDDRDLEQLKSVPAAAFEVVQLGPVLH